MVLKVGQRAGSGGSGSNGQGWKLLDCRVRDVLLTCPAPVNEVPSSSRRGDYPVIRHPPDGRRWLYGTRLRHRRAVAVKLWQSGDPNRRSS